MFFIQRKVLLISIFFVLLTSGMLNAQFIIKQNVYTIPVGFDLMPEDNDFQTTVEEAVYLLNLPEEKLRSSDMVFDVELEDERYTFFSDGKNLAVETIVPDFGKTTTILKHNDDTIYVISWPQKTVMEITPEAIESMKKIRPESAQTEDQTIPSSGTFEETGKSTQIRGFNCKQYINKGEDHVTMIWAAPDKNETAAMIRQAMENIKSMDPGSDENAQNEWNLLPGMIPVEIRSINTDDESDVPEIKIHSVIEIKNTMPSTEKFNIPGPSDGFQRNSMSDYLN